MQNEEPSGDRPGPEAAGGAPPPADGSRRALAEGDVVAEFESAPPAPEEGAGDGSPGGGAPRARRRR